MNSCGCQLSRRFFNVTLVTPLSSDPAGTLCHRALNPPRGSVRKPLCEINPFLPHPSSLKWVAPLTDSAISPIFLQADWFSTSHQGVNEQLTISSITRAPTASKEHNGNDGCDRRPVEMMNFMNEVCLSLWKCDSLLLFPQ